MRSSLLAVGLAVLLSAGLLGCGSGDDSGNTDPSTAPRTNMAARDSLRNVTTFDDPKPVPDVTLQTLDGDTLALAGRTGEVLLINFWATWCGPCREEIPDLVDLQTDLGPRGLTIVGVSTDQGGEEAVRSFLQEYDVNYPIVIDSTQRLQQSSLGPVYGLPTTLVVGPDGTVRKRVLGMFPAEAMRSDLEAMLKPPTPAS